MELNDERCLRCNHTLSLCNDMYTRKYILKYGMYCNNCNSIEYKVPIAYISYIKARYGYTILDKFNS